MSASGGAFHDPAAVQQDEALGLVGRLTTAMASSQILRASRTNPACVPGVDTVRRRRPRRAACGLCSSSCRRNRCWRSRGCRRRRGRSGSRSRPKSALGHARRPEGHVHATLRSRVHGVGAGDEAEVGAHLVVALAEADQVVAARVGEGVVAAEQRDDVAPGVPVPRGIPRSSPPA